MRWQLALLCALATATPASAVTMSFDFGNNARLTNLSGWNDVFHASGSPTDTLFVVVDENGNAVPGVTLVETDPFYIVGQPSQGGSESPSGAAAGFPVDATDDYYFGHTGAFGGGDDNPTGGFKLTGLDQNLAYDFTFFSSRTGVNDNRETAFSVTGANVGSGVIATSNNDSEVLSLNGITPDGNSEISIAVMAGPNNDNGNGFYYINLMQVSTAIPEPTTGLLLALAGGFAAFGRRRR
ncbi:PEP-CTERM sorting domain-containing protein [Bythopirellula polymerisocia]|uniref:Ice-binding protein C-terminal domain-containing protein n=1 Tax=Bythopirellula polymerisocia TaxID=2528003 RepID=A0A5C6D5C7_9BACT|nr:PEP-CTERM sorting domain-containing protein [Bythopirellula polymerisocia]TWU30426.1 hypothetical protein Pla144_12120 [Bythopirellula polymerisocia]